MYASAHAHEHISGASERIAFHRPDSGFCVLRVKVPGAPALVTVIGSAPASRLGNTSTRTGSGILTIDFEGRSVSYETGELD